VAVLAGPVARLGTPAVRWFGDGWTASVVGGASVLVWVAAALVLVRGIARKWAGSCDRPES
jgi:hypothetical protein